MATPNFCNFEASKYYAIGSDPNDEFIFDDTKENVYHAIKALAKEKRYSLRHYDERSLPIENNQFVAIIVKPIGKSEFKKVSTFLLTELTGEQ